ncbi:rCG25016 [Rattus norvegicus]|uniref:RCG25016 n=1 Tax=Rattus norvegicus TaxID=10116 RepID=A6KFE9_RAT|nr:rCG25016 [Rattus norvegicus]
MVSMSEILKATLNQNKSLRKEMIVSLDGSHLLKSRHSGGSIILDIRRNNTFHLP